MQILEKWSSEIQDENQWELYGRFVWQNTLQLKIYMDQPSFIIKIFRLIVFWRKSADFIIMTILFLAQFKSLDANGDGRKGIFMLFCLKTNPIFVLKENIVHQHVFFSIEKINTFFVSPVFYSIRLGYKFAN
jgi:hypothetical protein